MLKSMSLALMLACLGFAESANAWSPPGTLQRAAEDSAAAKMRTQFPAYAIFACQMRGNEQSVSIATRNRIGNQVNFVCFIRKVQNRNGTFRYEVSAPTFAQ